MRFFSRVLHNSIALCLSIKCLILIDSLVEFMDRMGICLGIPAKLCKEVALKRRFLHRACRYAELEFEQTEKEAVIADLLRIHSQFQSREPDHAIGLLRLTNSATMEWAELGQWHTNLQAYDASLVNDANDQNAMKGVMRVSLLSYDIE